MKKIDARGLSCPQPVLMTKKAVEGGAAEITVIVDNESAADNVSRFAQKSGFNAEIEKIGGDFKLVLKKVENTEIAGAANPRDEIKPELIGRKLLLITSDSLGRDDRELGTLLIKVLLNALAENEALPEKIVLMNAGVKLCCAGSESLESLGTLSNRGVELIACGTCLKHFNLTEKVRVGHISNAYEILDALLNGNVIPWA
jgi:selenium metabolism protein YedF